MEANTLNTVIKTRGVFFDSENAILKISPADYNKAYIEDISIVLRSEVYSAIKESVSRKNGIKTFKDAHEIFVKFNENEPYKIDIYIKFTRLHPYPAIKALVNKYQTNEFNIGRVPFFYADTMREINLALKKAKHARITSMFCLKRNKAPRFYVSFAENRNALGLKEKFTDIFSIDDL